MATVKEKILKLLETNPGMSDREITNILYDTATHQCRINIPARELAEKGFTVREKREDGRIGNYLSGQNVQKRTATPVISKNKIKENQISEDQDKPFQRIGSVSNAHVGRDFEAVAQEYFHNEGFDLGRSYILPLGVANVKKNHHFDLGTAEPPIIVECKSHRWTKGGNMPSAKIAVWNEAMYYFQLAPSRFRKVLFVLRDFSKKHGESLAEYYVRINGHLIPAGVEILEYDEKTGEVSDVKIADTH